MAQYTPISSFEKASQGSCGSCFLRKSLEQLLHRTRNLISWRKNCVDLLDSAFKTTDLNYIIYACRHTARFFYCRGAIFTAMRLLEKLIEIIPVDDYYNRNLIASDYRRFRNQF